ncbi:prepilin-type N-terminal cleavage/methylation domain-containing protein [Caldibacillus thermoamylovorans]|uniref:type II secretion system protein n=1 Tax=Caldibacillus thermoamylovorans TaxID=35841 RepID=UPI001D08298A|nr:prepilin-type N-terminal cleavage/methylation domain-containing protein [Caldibacillus thermoamylovorans]MCB5933483.1 prepilin-type N-terminal cleavage/methylation domain-containing protein [Bacillus sp. DFI.2.34]MCB7075598.1 prepilin-type N-terminal cleavage/methylation domain-containing protein [Caldibacillus thermoamylovorans]
MQKRMKLLKNQKGMTLVELLAVLVILGIIAAIAVPLIGNMIENSRDKAAINDAISIIAAAKLADSNGVAIPDGGYTSSTLSDYLEDGASTFTRVNKDSNGWYIVGHTNALTAINKKLETDIANDGKLYESTLKDAAKGND